VTNDNDTGATARRPIVPVTAAVVLANLVVLQVALLAVLKRAGVTNETAARLYPEDVWGPLMPIVLCQAVVSGLVLSAWPPSRRAGKGVLIGTVAAAVVGAVWFYFVLMSSFA
jgi:hypothetical protein